MRSIEKIRLEYPKNFSLEQAFKNDPIKQFKTWLKEAIAAKVLEPNGMILATVSGTGLPASRAVLLKSIDQYGFNFYTNYESRKGEHLSLHPYASVTFWWKEIYRQVNIEGKIKKLKRHESVTYFNKRPRGAQIAALASHQSTPLASRAEIEEMFYQMQKKFQGKEIPCPKNWGGYCLIPERIEFWQGQKNRLHDRFLYVKANNEWVLTRLSP